MSSGGFEAKIYSSDTATEKQDDWSGTTDTEWHPQPRLIQSYSDDQKIHVIDGTSDDEGRWTALVADSDWDENVLVVDDDWNDVFGDESSGDGTQPEEQYIIQQ